MQNNDAYTEKIGRDFSITFIQVVCAFAVITLHTNGVFWEFSSTQRYWFTANIIEGLLYFAVPIFFMVTGITLIDYQDRYSTKEFFKKRLEKVIIPYVTWSLFAVVFLLLTGRRSCDQISARWILDGLMSTRGIIDIYYFFCYLFCVYLSIPLFAAIEKDKRDKTYSYLLICGFLCNFFVPFVNSVFHSGLQWPYQISVVSGYLFYTAGGYYIYTFPPTKRKKEIIYVFAIIGLLLHIVGTYVLSIQANEIQRTFKEYNNVPCILYSFGVFLFLYDVGKRFNRVKTARRLILFLGSYTFPMYLMQWFVFRSIPYFFDVNYKSIWYRLFAPYAISAFIIAVTCLLRKIPGIRKIVP